MKVPKIPSLQNHTAASDQHLRDTNNYQRIVEKRTELSDKQLKMLIRQLNLLAEQSQTLIKFTLHGKSGHYYVRLSHSQTNELIRELSSQKLVDCYSDIEDFSGLLFDESI